MSQISIIIPVYNNQALLERALQSAMNQSLKDIEIIIIDDKNEDKSLKIALEFAALDARIKILQNTTHLGTFASRNKGILAAQSEVIMFLDSDDFLNQKACEYSFNLMQNKKADLLCFEALVHRVKTKKFYKFKAEEFKREEFFAFLLRQRHFCWSVWAKLFKKTLLLKALEFVDKNEDLSYGEDIFLCFLYFYFCEKIIISKEALYHYEFNENGNYENKNEAIIKRNLVHKNKGIILIEKLCEKEFAKDKAFLFLAQKMLEHLKKESKDLKARLEKI